MTMGQDALAVRIRRRRSERRLSISEAARQCGLTRWATWAQWERHTIPQSRHFAAIEETLRWEPGSVEAVLAGGEPTPLAEEPEEELPVNPYHDPVTGETYTDVAEQSLWLLRSAFAQAHIVDLGAERAHELGAERAREHIRLYRLQRDMPPRVA